MLALQAAFRCDMLKPSITKQLTHPDFEIFHANLAGLYYPAEEAQSVLQAAEAWRTREQLRVADAQAAAQAAAERAANELGASELGASEGFMMAAGVQGAKPDPDVETEEPDYRFAADYYG